MSSPPDEELPDVSTVAAVIARQTDDLALYADFLVGTIAALLPPGHLVVQRATGLRARLKAGPPPVESVAVLLGEERFVLQRGGSGHAPRASIGHEVGGIVLRTDVLALHDWVRRLAERLRELAAYNDAVGAALSRITGLAI